MIHYLLYSVPKDSLSQDSKKYFYAMFSSLSILVFSIIAAFLNAYKYQLYSGIAGFLGLIISGYYAEKFKKEKALNDYKDYNKELDNLRIILEKAKYNNPNSSSSSQPNKLNWYTKDKINYLIAEFEKLSSRKSKDPSIDILKILLIPVVTFAGKAIADKANLNTTISVALCAILVIISLWGVIIIFKSIFDWIFYSMSDSQAKRIHSLLKDLYIRDFDDSAPVNTNDSTQSNTP